MRNRRVPSWSPLDNAAKLFASVSGKSDPMVFRFVCELKEAVAPEILEEALKRTMPDFPTYLVILRRGLFWYYFEDSPLQPKVTLETNPPCSALYDRMRKSLLFSVTYYAKRINLEVHHVLTDGTGALQFLRTLVYHYLLLRYPELSKEAPLLDYDASQAQKAADSFDKYYTGSQSALKLTSPPAYHIKGASYSDSRMHILTGIVSVSALLKIVHERHTSMTAFLSSLLLCAIQEEMPLRERKKPVVLTIPVNLRNYFQSESVRNFFGTFDIRYHFSNEQVSFEDVLSSVTEQFKKELTPARLAVRMQNMTSMEHNPFARIVPLFLKDWALSYAYGLSEKGVTATLSNVGKITMPAALEPYIHLFDVFISTRRLQLCMCSYQDKLVLSITAPFLSTDIQKHFFRSLTALGLEVTIQSNLLDPMDAPQAPSQKTPRSQRLKPSKASKKVSAKGNKKENQEASSDASL